jgi:hypothetical protein
MKIHASIAAVACLFPVAALASDLPDPGISLRAPLVLPAPTGEVDPAYAFRIEPPQPDQPAKSRAFGSPDSGWWMSLGGGVAFDLNEDADLNIRVGLSTFVAQGVQIGGELGLFYFNLKGGDATGLNPALLIRWHFLESENWTLFLDGGIGVLFSTDDVPEGGTSFNFTPRLGVGFTRRLTDAGLRLEGGVRWHHVSNARITGDSNNPSRDLPMFHLGVVFPF